jgi:hypothetical protein
MEGAMEVVRMVLVTLALALAGVLVLALMAHAAAWPRRHRVDHLDVATAQATDATARQRS